MTVRVPRFRVLGPLGAHTAEGSVDLGGPKPRELLAVLLVHRNRVVPAGRGEPPPQVRDGAYELVAQ